MVALKPWNSVFAGRLIAWHLSFKNILTRTTWVFGMWGLGICFHFGLVFSLTHTGMKREWKLKLKTKPDTRQKVKRLRKSVFPSLFCDICSTYTILQWISIFVASLGHCHVKCHLLREESFPVLKFNIK